MTSIPEHINEKLLSIQELLNTGTNCFQFYFVKDNELPLLKNTISKIPKKDFNDLNLDLAVEISTAKIETEFNKLISENFSFIDGLNIEESTDLQLRNIVINKNNDNASYELHQDFNNDYEKYMFNILYYYNIDNCDMNQCGTGIVFIDKFGKRNYEILPVYPGLIIVLRDTCIFHHTPSIVPIDNTKPIIRTLLRKYVGFNRYENDKNILLQSINYQYLYKAIINKKIKDIEIKIEIEKCKSQEHKTENCLKYECLLDELNDKYLKINEDEQNKNVIEKPFPRRKPSHYYIKYIKYKNKYNNLKKINY